MRGLGRGLCLLVMLSAMSSSAYAQATLAGTAKDASGAVLPGVTVEAASDVLIEKARSGVTDGTGRYQIVDLRPGAYTVTYHAERDSRRSNAKNVLLTGTATTTIDADMRVGKVTETVTVSGETPIVDVQTTRRQTVLDQQVVTAIPTSRNSFSVGVLIPGVSLAFSGTLGSPNNAQDVGGSLGPSTESLARTAAACRISGRRSTASR